eukprot:GEMP01000897.1.p1 GENE.GEMP01000897.1~~GEMP01000897.1.p1  ORF type:complete len:1116 (+),score=225.79 GEMP01000897.1:115-3462(+)
MPESTVCAVDNELQVDVNPQVQECHPSLSGSNEQHQTIRFRDWFPSEDDDNARIAIRTLDNRAPLTYRDLRTQCLLFNTPLKGRVALVFDRRNTSELAVALIVLMDAGHIACPLDPKMSNPEMLDALTRLQCSVVVSNLPCMQSICTKLGLQIIMVQISATKCGVIEWPRVAASNEESNAGTWEPNADVLLLRTSGTTSRPKIVGLSTCQLQYGASAIATSLKLVPADVCLNVMPFFHIGGISCSLLAVLWARSTVICAPVFDAESFLATVEGELKPTWYYAVPTVHKAILLHLRATRAGPDVAINSHLRLIRSGATHLPHEDAMDLAKFFLCVVLPTYSMTECMPICSPPAHYGLDKTDSVGRVIGPVSLRIGDKTTGSPLPYGVTGDVLIRGPGVFKGYIDNGDAAIMEQNDTCFVDGEWFRTGDCGYVNSDGWLFLTGRSRAMVKRGGEQISMHEVDEAVRRHPDVDTCVTFAVPNPFWGEEVAAAVVLKRHAILTTKNASLALISFVRASGLAAYKAPAQIIVLKNVADIPQTSAGKCIRTNLHKELSVSPVDVSAANTLSAPTQKTVNKKIPFVDSSTIIGSTSIGGKSTVDSSHCKVITKTPSVCKALYGLRFILALWVVQRHVGLMPFKAWERMQNFSMNMTGFTFIAGFMTAASVTTPLRETELRQFYANRISAIHAMYLLGLVYALPFCFVIYWDKFKLMTMSHHIMSTILHLLAQGPLAIMWDAAPVLGVTWYQCMLYFNIAAFPLTDYLARKCNLRLLQFCVLPVGVFLSCAALPFLHWSGQDLHKWCFAWGFSAVTWYPVFSSGVMTYYVWQRNHPNDATTGRVKWAVITDALSLVFLAIIIVIASVECFIPETDSFFLMQCQEGVLDFSHSRLSSQLGDLIGWNRLCTPLIALWVYGLARGHGYTAALLGQKKFVTYLAPLAYPLYLLHLPTAMYVYWTFHWDSGANPPDTWWMFAGMVIVPIPWYSLFLTIAISLVLGALLQHYCCAALVPHIMKSFEPIGVFCCWCCPSPMIAESHQRRDLTTLAKVQWMIRSLTGANVTADTELDQIGVDSFGTAAFLGILRSKIPHAKKMVPGRLYELATVGELVEELDSLRDDQNIV